MLWRACCRYEVSSIQNRKPEVLIGTPGRILDHLSRDSFNPNTIETLIIDEFDKALELGFQDEMEQYCSIK